MTYPIWLILCYSACFICLLKSTLHSSTIPQYSITILWHQMAYYHLQLCIMTISVYFQSIKGHNGQNFWVHPTQTGLHHRSAKWFYITTDLNRVEVRNKCRIFFLRLLLHVTDYSIIQITSLSIVLLLWARARIIRYSTITIVHN